MRLQNRPTFFKEYSVPSIPSVSRRITYCYPGIGAVLFLAALIIATATPLSAHESLPANFRSQTLLVDLNEPVAIDFLPGGEMLVAERPGVIHLARLPYTKVDPTPVLTLFNIEVTEYDGGQGLLNLIVDPQFSANGYFYVFYTARFPARHRISRFTYNTDTGRALLTSEAIIWQDNVRRGQWHFGGGMAFGADGHFYFTTGDNNAQPVNNLHVSQDVSSSWGKVMRVRIEADGSGPFNHRYYSIPDDNPFKDDDGPNYDEIFALGLRNPFRLHISDAGRGLVTDVGGNIASTAQEEVNELTLAANYGWPLCEGINCQAGTAGVTPPIFSYDHEYPAGSGQFVDASITGGMIYNRTHFPEAYQGAYFYGDYAQNMIRYLTFDDQGQVVDDLPFLPADGSRDDVHVGEIVDIKSGPDGRLYYVDIGIPWGAGTNPNSGSVRRISHNWTGSTPPEVTIAADITSGRAPLNVAFSSSVVNPEAETLTYSWDFDTGDLSTEANPLYRFDENGPYSVRLTVSDGTHTTFSDPIRISVGATPVVSITQPISGTTFRVGDTIIYRGIAEDVDSELTVFNLSWRVVLHHSGHVHPFIGPQCCTSTGRFDIEETGHSWDGETWYEIVLTATDRDGLKNQSSVSIYPDKSLLKMDTVPSGLELGFDELNATTPFTRTSLVGFQHQIRAPETQAIDGTTYTFVGWLDAEEASRTINTPETDQQLIAIYSPACPAELLLTAGPTENQQTSLAALYRIRDEIFPTSTTGERYRLLFETYRSDIFDLLINDSSLRSEAVTLFASYVPGLVAFAQGGGDGVTLSAEMVDRLKSFLEALANEARGAEKGALADVIESESSRFDWPSFAGLSFDDAWNKILSDDNYLLNFPLIGR